MEINTLFQLFKDHFDSTAVFLSVVVGYFQVRNMMRQEIKHITDPFREMLATHNSRMEKIESRIDSHMLDGNRKWEANERRWEANERKWAEARAESEMRWAEMRKESQLLMQKIHCIELDQAKKPPVRKPGARSGVSSGN